MARRRAVSVGTRIRSARLSNQSACVVTMSVTTLMKGGRFFPSAFKAKVFAKGWTVTIKSAGWHADHGARRPAGDRPHGGGDDMRPGATVGGMKACAPQPGRPDHVGIHVGCSVKRDWGVILEEIHHLSGDLILVSLVNCFNNGFGCRAMPAAGIGKEKDNVRFSKGWIVHLSRVL